MQSFRSSQSVANATLCRNLLSTQNKNMKDKERKTVYTHINQFLSIQMSLNSVYVHIRVAEDRKTPRQVLLKDLPARSTPGCQTRQSLDHRP